MSRAKERYLEPADIWQQVKRSNDQGAPTVELCQMFRTIAQRMLRGPKYHGYSKELKEDMESAALEKCIRSYHNITQERAESCFSYLTLACQCAFIGVLKRHYRHVNTIERLRSRQIDALGEIDPIGAQKMREYYGNGA